MSKGDKKKMKRGIVIALLLTYSLYTVFLLLVAGSVYQERVGSKSCCMDVNDEANMDMSVVVGIDQALSATVSARDEAGVVTKASL